MSQSSQYPSERAMSPLILTIPALLTLFPLQTGNVNTTKLDVCYNYGCKDKTMIILTEEDLDLLRGLFHHLASAEDERQRIRQAVAMLEQIAGRQLPTINDVGGNYQKGMEERGQMDCIDESTNTTTYLTLLEQLGLLRWHEVEERAFRAPYLLDQHWAAQIKEHESGQHYAVDSWPDANGMPPLLQSLEDWQKKRPTRKSKSELID